MLKNGVQLITYPDSLGGTIEGLSEILQQFFTGAFTGIHLLPFYPSSADRGFAPLMYTEVDPRFGSWEQVESLAQRYDLTVDIMVNHLSRSSMQFQDYREKGNKSRWADLFLQVVKVYPDGVIPPEDLKHIYTRKPRSPVTTVTHPDGSSELLWCTFSEEQIDLDVHSQVGLGYLESNIRFLCERGISVLRLDAFAYVTKKAGTNCFFIEPEIWEILERIRNITNEYRVALLPEIHEHYSYQLKLERKGYRVYDFALPMVLLHTVFSRNARRLKEWFGMCPRNQMTTLDTHDGIGVVDAEGILTPEELDTAVNTLYKRGSNINRRYSSAEYNNLDIYQINCTFYSALGEDDNSYILCRAVQFFAPGIPQVYYVGALSGSNDIDLVEKTKQGRDINRHAYSKEEVKKEMERPVNMRLLRLMRFRSETEVFDGAFTIMESKDSSIVIRRTGINGAEAILTVDLENLTCSIEYTDAGGHRECWVC